MSAKALKCRTSDHLAEMAGERSQVNARHQGPGWRFLE